MSSWHPTRLLTGYAWDSITAACLLGANPPKRLLLLGLGGGTVVRQLLHLLPSLEVTAIEIDPAAIERARTLLGALADHVDIIEADAYDWVLHGKETFDCLVDDVYASGADDVFRPRLIDAEMILGLRRLVNTNGIFVANFVIGDNHDIPYETAKRAFVDLFPFAAAVTPLKGFNSILVGGSSLETEWQKSWVERWAKNEQYLWAGIKMNPLSSGKSAVFKA